MLLIEIGYGHKIQLTICLCNSESDILRRPKAYGCW